MPETTLLPVRLLRKTPVWAQPVLFALLYFGGAWLGDGLTFQPSQFNTFWPNSGFFLAVLLLQPSRRWPLFILAAIPANIAFDLIHGRPLWLSACFTLANASAALSGALLIRRFIIKDFRLSNVRELWGLFFITAFCSLPAGSLIGSLAVHGTSGLPLIPLWIKWWIGDVVGVLLIAPLLLTWNQPFGTGQIKPARLIECLAAFLALFYISWMVLHHPLTESGFGKKHLILIPLLYLAMRFPVQIVVMGSLSAALIGVWASSQTFSASGLNPDSLHMVILEIQGFFTLAAGFSLILGLTLRTDRDTQEKLRRSEAELLRNLGELKAAEADKSRAEDQLRQAQKMEAVGQLAGGVAHDFNNHLAAIMGNAESLAARLAPHPELGKYADRILISTQHSADLTRQLLAFARKSPARSEIVDIHQAVRQTAAILERSIDPRIRLTLDLAADPCTVLGDPGLLQNTLLNLAINARDAMPEGGELRFATSNPSPEALPEAHNINATSLWVLIEVSDTGCGMDPETAAHCFDPFFTTKEKSRGTGLGLSVVYGTVRQLGGSVSVRSKPGRGSRFSLRLPAAAGTPAPGVAEPLPRTRPLGVLVVDDDEAVRETLRQQLADLGHRVYTAPDGPAGLSILGSATERIDLVILDMIMPGMTGRDTYRAIRGLRPDLAVLLVSGFTEEGAAEALLSEGVRGFLQKPFRRERLARVLASLFPQA